jgi:glycosyltransferase involved in cell wall biosynthesis
MVTVLLKVMNTNKISTSLFISTYNWPEALNLCLLSIRKQRILPDEVVIADDGSTEETRKLIEKHQLDFPVPLLHVWQPDEGFQLARIRNKAIAASTNKYIIQIDGDLILHPSFIADHIDLAKKGSFVTGSRVILNSATSETLLRQQKTAVNILKKGISNRMNGIRLKVLRNYFSEQYRVHDIYYLRGCNMAFWRNDLVKVNGYNEDFISWGREDNEIAARLINAGLKKRIIKFGGIVYHIFHAEKARTVTCRNQDLLNEAISNKKTVCTTGINQYPNLM